jgi:hypothetical protein
MRSGDIVDITPVDPRDMKWEVGSSCYRVYFWEQQASPGDSPEEAQRRLYMSSEYELTNVKGVSEVLAWASKTAKPNQIYTVYVVVERPDGKGICLLEGTDPTVRTV